MSAALSRRISTPAALKMEALQSGWAKGDAGGWSLVLTKPALVVPPEFVVEAERMARYIAERDGKEPPPRPTFGKRSAVAVTLSDWWFSGKRHDRRTPNATNLRFLRKFAIELGAPEHIEPIGAYYFLWPPEKASDRC